MSTGSSNSLVSSVLRGYSKLFSGLLRVTGTILLLASASAVIALPIWLLSVRFTRMFTILTVSGLLIFLLFQTVRLIRNSFIEKTAGRTQGPGLRKSLTRAVLVLLCLISLNSAVMLGIHNNRPAAVLVSAAALLLFSLLIRDSSKQ